MASTLRTARSNAAPAAPAGRGSDDAARPAARPHGSHPATPLRLATRTPRPAPHP